MRQAREALYQYLSPYTGGPEGQGWPIGRDLHVSEIYARLQRIPSVEYVEDVRVTTGNPDLPGTHDPVDQCLRYALELPGEEIVDALPVFVLGHRHDSDGRT